MEVKDTVTVKVYEYLTLKDKISALYVKACETEMVDEVYAIRDGLKILLRSFQADGVEGSEMACDYVNFWGNRYPNLTKLNGVFVDLNKVAVKPNEYYFMPLDWKAVVTCDGHKLDIDFFDTKEVAGIYVGEICEKLTVSKPK